MEKGLNSIAAQIGLTHNEATCLSEDGESMVQKAMMG